MPSTPQRTSDSSVTIQLGVVVRDLSNNTAAMEAEVTPAQKTNEALAFKASKVFICYYRLTIATSTPQLVISNC